MKRKIFLLLAGVCFAFVATAQWTIDSVNTAGIYPYNGATTSKAVLSNGTEWNVFDATTNAHSSGMLSQSRANIVTLSYGDKVYFAGGRYGYFADPVFTKNIDVYNAVTDSWTTLLLSKNRENFGAAAAGNKVVFAGGRGSPSVGTPQQIYSTADIFDATTGARTTAKLSKARTNLAAGAAGNKIVFAGGWYWDFYYNMIVTNVVDIYDVSTNTWSKTTLSKKRDNISVAVVGNKIIFAGGTPAGGVDNTVDVYDASTDTWITGTLPHTGFAMKSVVIGDNAYFSGGSDPNAIDIYNAVTNTWATIYLPISVSGFSMSVINDKIFFAGGYFTATSSYSDLVQIFDPATITWTNATLSIPRNSIAAVSCMNKGYFAGGYIAYGYPIPVGTNRVDIYASSAPLPDFTASTTSTTVGGAIDFADNSSNNPTAWSWIFDGGTPGTSNEQFPTVQYNAAGTFDVTLTVTNAAGSNTITKTNFITVNPAPCVAPTVLSTADITSTTATLNWNAVSGAVKYKVSYKQAGNYPWITVTLNSTSWNLTGLLPNTSYAWKVKSSCGGSISSPFSPNQLFSTLAGKQSPAEITSALSIYPQPVADQFRITGNGDIAFPLTCRIYDMYGSVIKEVVLNDYSQFINVSGLKQGNYFVTVVDGSNQRFSTIMTKQ